MCSLPFGDIAGVVARPGPGDGAATYLTSIVIFGAVATSQFVILIVLLLAQ
jgi:hypothetical protein